MLSSGLSAIGGVTWNATIVLLILRTYALDFVHMRNVIKNRDANLYSRSVAPISPLY